MRGVSASAALIRFRRGNGDRSGAASFVEFRRRLRAYGTMKMRYAIVVVALAIGCDAGGDDSGADAGVGADTGKGDQTTDPAPTLPAGYEAMTGCAKQQLLFNDRIFPSAYPGSFLPEWGIFDVVGFGLLDMRVTLDRVSDELPVGRKKIFHKLGTVATVELRPVGNSRYTGLFRGGCGLVRLSLSAGPFEFGYTPGLALKMFVDGAPSENLMVMNSLDGQDDNHNFFAATFTNVLPEPQKITRKLLMKILRR